jgi:hypothetical protein
MLKLNLGGTVVNDVVCINLKKRKTRKIAIKRQARKKNFPVRFFQAVENTKHPNLGKFASHLKCIEGSRRKRCKSIFILEDDAKILTSRLSIPEPPVKWDMLYLGGNIQSVLQDDDTDASRVWKRACVLLTHAYIINASAYDLIISEGHKVMKEDKAVNFDEWLCNTIHPQLQVYAAIPERVIQVDGYSDVKGMEVTYRQQLTGGSGEGQAPERLSTPPQEEVEDESGGRFLRIKMPPAPPEEDLPAIALVTCVHNQLDLFQQIQWSYYTIDYPREKLTWIIVDDSPNDDKVAPLVDGADTSIKYVSCDMETDNDFLSVARKLNIAMTHMPANAKFMLHYSPDCYYAVGSVRARVRLMLANPDYGCFGCTKYGVYDLSKEESLEQYSLDGKGNPTLLFGPSLSYTREWWQARSFEDTRYTLETFYYVRGRWEGVMDIPYGLVLIALTWDGHQPGEVSRYGLKGKATVSGGHNAVASKNQDDGRILTDQESGRVKRDKGKVNFSDDWDLTTKNMMLMLGSLLGGGVDEAI